MAIQDFTFVSPTGSERKASLGVGADPFFGDYQIQNEGGPIGARWKFEDKDIYWAASGKVLIYPSPDQRFVVVVFVKNFPPEAFPPHNALVLNADGSIRQYLKQPLRYAGQPSCFLDAWWYEHEVPQPRLPWWMFWRDAVPPRKEIRMKMLIEPYAGNPTGEFEALAFDPETGEFGDVVDKGRL